MALIIQPAPMRDFRVEILPGTGLRGRQSFSVEIVDEPGMPYDGKMTVEFQSRRYVCAAMTLKQRKGGTPVTSEGVRSIPMASLVRRSVLQGQVILVHETSSSPGVVMREPGSSADLPSTKRRRRRRGEDVDATARVYAVAAATGQAPTKAVCDELGIPLGTARRLVAQAREAGYLPPPP